MLDLSDRPTETAALSPTAPMQIGLVTLNVQNLESVSDYYRRVIGLEVIATDGTTQRLGAAGTALLELRGDAALAPRDPRSAGLFHTAFLMPSRGDLGAWLRYVASSRLPVAGASDHAVSEAIYLSDPEGNGIEVYGDRPRSTWPSSAAGIEMTTEALDVQDLLAEEAGKEWRGAPAGMIVGHMHLQTGRLTTAEAFYKDLLGFDVTCRYPGAVFYGAGGYHHQLATNMWNSRGAGAIAPKTTGLAGYEIILDTLAQRNEIVARAEAAGLTAQAEAGTIVVPDPSGLGISLSLREGA